MFQTAEPFTNPVSAVFQGQCAIVSSINDRNDWKTVKNALQIINIDEINTKVSYKQAFRWFCHPLTVFYFLGRSCLGSLQAFFTWGTFASALTVRARPSSTTMRSCVESQMWEINMDTQRFQDIFIPFTSFSPAAPWSGCSQSPGRADVPKDRSQDWSGAFMLKHASVMWNLSVTGLSPRRSSALSRLTTPSMPEMLWLKPSTGTPSPGWSIRSTLPWRTRWGGPVGDRSPSSTSKLASEVFFSDYIIIIRIPHRKL